MSWLARAKARFHKDARDATDKSDEKGFSSVPSVGSEGSHVKAPDGFVGFVGRGTGALAENAVLLPATLQHVVDRLDTAGMLAPGDHDLIADMHELDPEGTAWLLGDMLVRAAKQT